MISLHSLPIFMPILTYQIHDILTSSLDNEINERILIPFIKLKELKHKVESR